MKYLYVSLVLAAVALLSCGKSEIVFDDYREEFIGTYDCTKSNRSFEDENFIDTIVVEVELDSLSENSVIVNDITIPIDENGRFERGNVGNDWHDLDLAEDRLRWEVNVYFPLGIALPCYIKGEKRN